MDVYFRAYYTHLQKNVRISVGVYFILVFQKYMTDSKLWLTSDFENIRDTICLLSQMFSRVVFVRCCYVYNCLSVSVYDCDFMECKSVFLDTYISNTKPVQFALFSYFVHFWFVWQQSHSRIQKRISACYSLTFMQISREGTGGLDPTPPPLKNYKAIGFLAILVQIYWKITKLPSHHSMLGQHQHASETPFKWLWSLWRYFIEYYINFIYSVD